MNNNFRQGKRKLRIEPFTEIECSFRASDLPDDIQIIQRRPPLIVTGKL